MRLLAIISFAVASWWVIFLACAALFKAVFL